MYSAYTQLMAEWSSPSIGDQRATGCLPDSQTLKDRATPFPRSRSGVLVTQFSNFQLGTYTCLQIFSALLVACAIIEDSESATYKRQHLANSSLLFLQKVNPVKMKVVKISQNFPM